MRLIVRNRGSKTDRQRNHAGSSRGEIRVCAGDAYAAATRLPLTAIVIDNQSATHGWPGGISARFPGWITSVIDGRDHDQIERALTRRHHDRPNLVVATVEPKRG